MNLNLKYLVLGHKGAAIDFEPLIQTNPTLFQIFLTFCPCSFPTVERKCSAYIIAFRSSITDEDFSSMAILS